MFESFVLPERIALWGVCALLLAALPGNRRPPAILLLSFAFLAWWAGPPAAILLLAYTALLYIAVHRLPSRLLSWPAVLALVAALIV